MSEEQLTAESSKRLGSKRAGGLLSAISYAPGVFVAGLLALLFFGALFWARGRDPFRRVWFSVKVPGQGKAQCVAVLPRSNPKSNIQNPKSYGWPVVIYLNGSGESLLRDGNELRQMAEMGLAAVGMEDGGKAESRNQKAEMEGPGARSAATGTEDGFDAQFSALLNYVGRQGWADTNRMAWVGSSLGAQHALAFALHHFGSQPRLLVLVAGGWVPELEQFKVQSSGFKVQSSLVPPSTSVLLLHGEHDEVFPLSEARRVAARLETNGVPVELKVLPGEGRSLGATRLLVFRVIGEQCLTRLAGPDALANYRSILSWQAQAKPLWLFWTPAFVWGCLWLWSWRRRAGNCACRTPRRRSADLQSAVSQIWNLPSAPASGAPEADETPAECNSAIQQIANLRYAKKSPRRSPALHWWEIGLRWLAATLAIAAVAQSALHLVPPHLPVSERTLAIARNYLVAPKEKTDFEVLAAKPVWRRKPLKTLLEHVELTHYNRELINWKLDEPIYRQYVLSPQIDPTADGALNWRRTLWENLYPRIRREQDPAAAAETVVRFLRERVTIAQGSALPTTVPEIWQHQIATGRGFEALYIAALRSVGVPARFGAQGRSEFWTGSAWQPAPRPLVEAWN